jgi:hypothetical protein
LVSAGILALILILALFMMRVRREDLSSVAPGNHHRSERD